MLNTQSFPAIYSNAAHPKMSQRYSFVSTAEIVSKFEKQGWEVRTMQQSRTRDAGETPFAAHQVRMGFGKFGGVGDTVPELIIGNSHNGKKTLNFKLGLMRIVCTNGLVIPMPEFNETFNIRHTGVDDESIKLLTDNMADFLPTVNERVRVMQETSVKESDAIEFLRESVKLRWDSDGYQFNYDDMLTAKRDEDKPLTAWNVFNIAQEKLIRGEISYEKKGKNRKAQPIKNFIRENDINTKLWEKAELMMLS